MRLPVFCFLKERDRHGQRQGAGCKRVCSGCDLDKGILFIDEVPPDYQRGRDHAHKRKKYQTGVLASLPPGEYIGVFTDARR